MKITASSISILATSLAVVALLGGGDAVAGPQTRPQFTHTHTCPCWSPDDAASQDQLCSCAVSGHTASVYGVQCASTDSNAATDLGSPAGGGGPIIRPAPRKPAVSKIKPAIRLDCLRFPTAAGC